MLTKILCGLVILAGSGIAFAADGVFDRNVQLQLDIDALGHLAHVEVPADTPPALADLLITAANGWTYSAPQRDGHGLAARTWAHVILHMTPASAGNVRVGVERVANGPGVDERFVPVYPEDALARHVEAFVVVSMTVKPDGTLGDATFDRADVSIGSDRNFRKSILASLHTWHAHPELVDGKPIATRVRVPFVFDARPAGRATPSAFIERMQNGIASVRGGADAPANSMRAVDSPVGIKDTPAH